MSERIKLMASSPSLEGITALINQFWYSNGYSLSPLGEDKWNIIGTRGIRTDYRVTFKNGRYRFERVSEVPRG